MDRKIEKYRTTIVGLLKEYSSVPSVSVENEQVEEQLIIDTENDHYQILTIGWEQGKRVYYPVFHLDIKNDKVWVQEDASDFDLVGKLEEKGISATDIVLAFQPPIKRPHTGYAVM